MKVENKPVKIPDESFKETELPQKKKHIYILRLTEWNK